jgi:transportin-1
LCAVEAYKQDPANNILPDKDIIVVSLDLIGAIVQGLGGKAEGLLLDPTEPTIFTILKLTMNDETADVRSCSFALVGDIAINCFRVTVPHINDFINLACANIDEKADFSRTSSMNNACWSVGEIAVRYDAQMAPYVTSLLMKLVPLMLNRSTVRSLLENSSITIGRLAKSNPQLIAPHYHQFLGRWLEILSNISDNHEKQEAVMGVCAVLKQNPVPIFENFVEFVNMVSSKNDNPHVKNEIYEVLGFIRGQIKPEDWDILLGKLGEGLRERFRLVYGF